MRKYYTLKNVLEIKLATYNYDPCVAFMKEYPMVMKLAKRLKDDTTVAAKIPTDSKMWTGNVAESRVIYENEEETGIQMADEVRGATNTTNILIRARQA